MLNRVVRVTFRESFQDLQSYKIGSSTLVTMTLMRASSFSQRPLSDFSSYMSALRSALASPSQNIQEVQCVADDFISFKYYAGRSNDLCGQYMETGYCHWQGHGCRWLHPQPESFEITLFVASPKADCASLQDHAAHAWTAEQSQPVPPLEDDLKFYDSAATAVPTPSSSLSESPCFGSKRTSWADFDVDEEDDAWMCNGNNYQ